MTVSKMQIGNDWPRQNGREHGAAPKKRRTRHRGVRHEPGQRGRSWSKRRCCHGRELHSLIWRRQLEAPRAVWVMVPSGDPTEKTVMALKELFAAGDTVIDGGNSFYKDDVRRAKSLSVKKDHIYGCGHERGGLWGLERGYCLMVGGEKETVARVEPILKTLAPGRGTTEPTEGRTPSTVRIDGYLHCGPVGAG